MKIHVMSDLHFELHRDGGRKFLEDLNPGDSDVLILAGDIISVRFLDQIRRVFKSFCDKYKHVVYVPGNHEYYNSDPKTVRNLLSTISGEFKNLHVLNHGVAVIDGQRFLGGTMWFKLVRDTPFLKRNLSDYFEIKDFVPWVYEQNTAFESYLKNELKEGDVVVTHHLPTPLSIPGPYKLDSLNIFFLNDVSRIIMQKRPKLWVHGHTHNACDYVIDATRVVCNPLGYPFEARPFNDKFIVEV